MKIYIAIYTLLWHNKTQLSKLNWNLATSEENVYVNNFCESGENYLPNASCELQS